jgi:H+-translocating NAD(P) transhydrogenase subunit alpha
MDCLRILIIVVLCLSSGFWLADVSRGADLAAETSPDAVPAGSAGAASAEPAKDDSQITGLIAGLTIFALAIFVGFEVITKVPPTLHTPLMSGSNAISGITLVGAVVVAGSGGAVLATVLGTVAVALATINVVGGFLVTHRMLKMFRKK